ncbi:hypothetical protein EYC80_003214 [Monilinia laxa]|uniref:Uncharacterized protein n=1 Tax=Monilinia laxa TaxID=61186 RepID=A0A5N6KD08_MONLA|nr:hypothetical protein EYC80_003214 [Monilinia laxa]
MTFHLLSSHYCSSSYANYLPPSLPHKSTFVSFQQKENNLPLHQRINTTYTQHTQHTQHITVHPITSIDKHHQIPPSIKGILDF